VAAFDISIPHRLGREAALARVQRFLEDLRQSYSHEISDLCGQWDDNQLDFSFAARGLTVQGRLVVEESFVRVAGPLPLAALFFRGRIEQTIRQELEKLLAGT
jgi:hypothetical protein